VPIDNPMSLNVVDICPVGALIDKNFLYSARVWFSKRVDSVCASCSVGCNTVGTVVKNELKRIQPRENMDVNQYWMCDYGRLNREYLDADNRAKLARGNPRDLAKALPGLIAQHGPGSIAILASTYATLEELYLIRKLADELAVSDIGFYTKVIGERWVAKNGFAIETDKTPNTRGVQHVFDGVPGVDAVLAGLHSKRIRGLISINGIPDFEIPAEVVAAVDGLELLAVGDIQSGPLMARAHFVLPGATVFEKEGTFANKNGRVQRIRPMVLPSGQSRPESVWLQELLVALGARRAVLSPESVFRELFPSCNYAMLGKQGLPLEDATRLPPVPAEAVVPGSAK
jgi:NADH-quinone oxidoreductase subunit G